MISKLFTPNRKQKSTLDRPPTYCQPDFNHVHHQPSVCGFQTGQPPLHSMQNQGYSVQLYPQAAVAAPHPQQQTPHQHHHHHHHAQPQHQHHQQPIQTMTMSPTCGCQPGATLQSPQQAIQPGYQLHNTYQVGNDTLDTSARLEQPVTAATVAAAPQLGLVQTMQQQNFSSPGSAAYQTTGPAMQIMPTNGHQQQQQQVQSSRFCDNNSYYSNQMTLPQQQQQQQTQPPRHQQPPTHQPQGQTFTQFQQRTNSNSNNYINNTSGNDQQLDDQRSRLQQQQQQQQQRFQQEQLRPQQQLLQQQPQMQQLVYNMDNQMKIQQQQYQNHDELANGTSDELPLEASCLMYERDFEELYKMANSLKSDIKDLASELSVIKRETPEYSVIEVKI